MGAKKINKDLLILSILTVITVFTWICFDIYRILNKPSSIIVPPEALRKLDLKFDPQLVNSLKSRKIISQIDMDSVPELITLELKPISKLNNNIEATNPASYLATPSASESVF